MEEMVKWASTPLQQWFVKEVVLERYHFFAPQVYILEVLVALSLIIGLFKRLGAVLGGLMAINLWLGPQCFNGAAASQVLVHFTAHGVSLHIPRRVEPLL
jgi:uncharacterized membrane protein YphA (DoxX/SURF4 family)